MPQTLQKESRTPLYLQLAEVLRRGILSKEIEPGSPLPPERVLCDRHEVSRATVREAISLLKSEGFVVTRRGAGNFAALPVKIDRDLLRIHDFNLQIEESGRDSTVELLEYDPAFHSERIASVLRIEACCPIIRAMRLRFAGETPLFLETLYLPKERFPREDEASLTSTNLVLGRMRDEYGIRIGEVILELEPVLVSERQADILKVESTPCAGLLNKRTSFDESGVPALYTEWLFAGGNCRHLLTLMLE